MKHGKTREEIERDERDVEDMRKDDALIIEPRGAKKGHGTRSWAHSTEIIDPGASQAQ
jgi:hypothetical protein